MHALSPLDGSADAVQAAAAAAPPADDNRLALERELDRLNIAIHGAAAALGQHLNAILVSQSMLLLAYLVVLVGGWSAAIPGKRWLMAGIAGFGIAVVVLAYFGLRGARDRTGPLKLQRQRLEEALERVAARPPAFARQGAVSAVLAQLSTRALPLLIVGGWVWISIYTLALPMPTDGRVVTGAASGTGGTGAAGEARPAGAATRAARPAVAKSTAAPAAEAAAQAPVVADNDESPLLKFFRRIASEPPVEQPEQIKP